MLNPTQSGNAASDLVDFAGVTADLAAIAKLHGGRENEMRVAVAQRLKTALLDGRKAAEDLLLKDRHGRHCAERLCHLQDEIIRQLFEFARRHLYASDNPSEAERMAVVPTGGHGRRPVGPGGAHRRHRWVPYEHTDVGRAVTR